MPEAARLGDSTQHGNPLAPGIGSPDVLIGMKPAWRALPASVGAAIEAASKAMDDFMKTPVLTPASAASKIAKNSQALIKSGAKAAGKGNPAGTGAAAGGVASVNTANVALTATWTAASPVPGGQPAANTAYTEGIKAVSAVAASSLFAAVGSMADTHICPVPCPIPPHGPGMVVKGSNSVLINNLPAARKDDKVMEACGGADPIAMGCSTVLIGDDGGGGGGGAGGGGGGGGKSGGDAGKKGGVSAATQDKSGEAGGPTSASIQSLGVTCECANPNCAAAFKSAADDGTPLVDRETYGCSGPAKTVVDTGEHWIGVHLVDEENKAIPNEPYAVKLPDGREHGDKLDSDGKARVDGIKDPGKCKITFPKLDKDSVEDA